MDSDQHLATLKEVERLLVLRGVNAHLEYPGFILVGDWAFGTANENWGGDNSFAVEAQKQESVEFDIANDSTDASAIAEAISSFVSERQVQS